MSINKYSDFLFAYLFLAYKNMIFYLRISEFTSSYSSVFYRLSFFDKVSLSLIYLLTRFLLSTWMLSSDLD